MATNQFIPHHIGVTRQDLAGNGDIGRYVFLPGSDSRAKEIASHFNKKSVKTHPRGHDVYLGTISVEGHKIDVAAVSSGMGCASTEIIVHELYHLGVKRFLRVGTAGLLQPDLIKVGSIVNVQASVRDEDTSLHYAPKEVPAVAALEFVSSCLLAAEHLKLSDNFYTGVVHCKGALYAREFAVGPKHIENQAYLNLLTEVGVLASEMETATLFIQSQLYNQQLKRQGKGPAYRVLAGAILAVIGNFEATPVVEQAMKNAIEIALETVKILASQEIIG
jgi:uridine phosphorylase